MDYLPQTVLTKNVYEGLVAKKQGICVHCSRIQDFNYAPDERSICAGCGRDGVWPMENAVGLGVVAITGDEKTNKYRIDETLILGYVDVPESIKKEQVIRYVNQRNIMPDECIIEKREIFLCDEKENRLEQTNEEFYVSEIRKLADHLCEKRSDISDILIDLIDKHQPVRIEDVEHRFITASVPENTVMVEFDTLTTHMAYKLKDAEVWLNCENVDYSEGGYI